MGVVDILINDGSPMGIVPSDVYGEFSDRVGLGGAEIALFNMINHWVDIGHHVRLYNNPRRPDPTARFEQMNMRDFHAPDRRDVLITFRSPCAQALGAYGKKVWWSCDQQTVGNYKEFSKTQDEIVCISPHHAQYFYNRYGIERVHIVDLPVNLADYDKKVDRYGHRAMFTSVPDRGLPILAGVWDRIVERVPDAELVVTSGWTLWDGRSDEQRLLPYRMLFRGKSGRIDYRGAVKRKDLVDVQLSSGVFANSNVYEELFCYALAEAQVAGAIPVTSTTGSLNTTCIMESQKNSGDPWSAAWQSWFVDKVVEAMLFGDGLRDSLVAAARERFSVERIGRQWENVF